MLRLFDETVRYIAFVTVMTAIFGVSSCSSTRKGLSYQPGTNAADSTVLPFDPWLLCPDVFRADLSLNVPVRPASVQEWQDPTIKPSNSEGTIDSTNVQGPQNQELVGPESEKMTLQDLDSKDPEALSQSHFTVQLGTFLDRDKASEFYTRASDVLGIIGKIQSDWPFYRIRFGEFSNRESADSLYRAAMANGFYDSRVLKISVGQ